MLRIAATLAIGTTLLAGSACLVMKTAPVGSRSPVAETSVRLTPSVLDLGQAQVPANLQGRFSVVNPLREAVTIEQINSSCSCTAVDFRGPVVLEPGERLDLGVELRLSENDFGMIRKSLTLLTNGEPVTLGVTAEALGRPRVTVSPALVEFAKVGSWEEPARTVEVRCGAPVTLRATSSSISDPIVEFEGPQQQSAGILAYRLALPLDLPRGKFSGTGTIETNHGTVRFSYQGEKVGPVFATSETVVFRRSTGDTAADEFVATVTLRHDPRRKLESVTAASGDIPFQVGAISPISAGLTRVVLSHASGSTTGPVSGEMILLADRSAAEDAIRLKWYLARKAAGEAVSPL